MTRGWRGSRVALESGRVTDPPLPCRHPPRATDAGHHIHPIARCVEGRRREARGWKVFEGTLVGTCWEHVSPRQDGRHIREFSIYQLLTPRPRDEKSPFFGEGKESNLPSVRLQDAALGKSMLEDGGRG